MEKLIRWFVNNKVVSNLLMILIIITGATTIPMLKMEVFPEIDLNIINVTAVYPGATPTDVEEAICIKIEERLQGLDGVKKVTSNASENVGNVNIEIISGQDPNEMLDKIKAEVDAIDTFPENVEKPLCRKISGSNPVISVAVEPKTKGDMEKLSKALQALSEEDPTFKVSIHPDTGQTIIAGMGELHLEVLVDRLLREIK